VTERAAPTEPANINLPLHIDPVHEKLGRYELKFANGVEFWSAYDENGDLVDLGLVRPDDEEGWRVLEPIGGRLYGPDIERWRRPRLTVSAGGSSRAATRPSKKRRRLALV